MHKDLHNQLFVTLLRNHSRKHLVIWFGYFSTQVINAQSAVHQCTADVDFMEEKLKPYPATFNDEGIYSLAKIVGEQMFGEANVLMSQLVLGAEDFSFYTERIPGAGVDIGVRNESIGAVHGLHSPHFFVDEEVLPMGAAFNAAVALAYLDEV